VIQAAGGVLWRFAAAGQEVAVVHRPRYDDWSLPKGKLTEGEPHLLAALREIREETGIAGTAGASLGSTEYDAGGSHKTVRWWSVRAGEGEFAPNDEVDELRWVPPAEAIALVREVAPLQRWLALPADAGIVLLVRHGSAGDPSAWRGDDDDRPLDEEGRRQAELIARVLPSYRPRRIVCAPPLRCRETITPLAAELGLQAEIDGAIGERGAPTRPERHVIGLAVPGETVVVCSQGGVIPRVLEALVATTAPARARKGSVWALTMSGAGAIAADDAILT
jgi:8-oxo-dGTP pyrophosphatase MutT (NUDIX family)/phosphohistidine phosphatase SixA